MVTALNEDTINIRLEVERLRTSAKHFKMCISPALHMPVATADSDANRVVPPVGKQRFQLIPPTVAILKNGYRQIGPQQMVVGAGEPDIGEPGSLKIDPKAVDQWEVGIKTQPHPLPSVILDDYCDAIGNTAGADMGLLAVCWHPNAFSRWCK